MSTELMRCMDYWLGIPLCFLLTFIHYILRFLVFKRGNAGHRKLLFIKLSEMGSIILAYPLMNRAQKECRRGCELFFLTFKENEPLLKILNVVPSSNTVTIRQETIGVFILDTLKAV